MNLKVTAAIGTALAGVLLVPYLITSNAINTVSTVASNMTLADVACAAIDMKLGDGLMGLTSEQTRNAEIIISVGAKLPVRARVVAIATAMQESGLRNLDHGDRDSVGLFQQRPSQGWGSREEIMDPYYSSRQFYDHLVKVRDWQKMPVTDAAQAVQRSGFPDAYAKHENKAVQIVASSTQGGVHQINSATTGCSPLTTPASTNVSGYVSYALQQVGKPYVWGGTGPDGFDCSGLIVFAWRQMGYQLKIRTSQQMYDVSVPVKSGTEKTGDLIFAQFESGGPAHVMVVVKPGLLVEAPRTGLDVRVREYDASSEGLKFGRLPSSQMTAISAQA
ncbi:C40 family peptidase [Streptomyces justiciae]|uniref:C40 family peptidase n=1 Tax=Streptomyces justiciae TaxID=2780140 RepID=UPI0021187140|nr:C40 family peptidase [Streptomyces justiciae]MCW8383933.1 C40 family peptidase [Streptomyces justiciae]